MLVLSVDQARNGAWCIYEYETKKIVEYSSFSFDKGYSLEQAIIAVCDEIQNVIESRGIDAVFIEDISLRKNADTFKKLAWLQGSLVTLFEREEYLYQIVAPSTWQNYCMARGRTTKEKDADVRSVTSGKKGSKVLSMQFCADKFDIHTENDNLADAICIGWWAVNNITIRKSHRSEHAEK